MAAPVPIWHSIAGSLMGDHATPSGIEDQQEAMIVLEF
jgi:hypothetical protein